MSNGRSFLPTSQRSASRRLQREMGRTGRNGKPTRRARARDDMIRRIAETGAYECPSCHAVAVAVCDRCAQAIPCPCVDPAKDPHASPHGNRVMVEHEDGCRLLRDPKPTDAPSEEPKARKDRQNPTPARARGTKNRRRNPASTYGKRDEPWWGGAHREEPAPSVAEARNLIVRHPELADLRDTLAGAGFDAREIRRRVREAAGKS